MVKQAKLTGGTMPSSAVVALAAGEGGQPTAKVGLGAAEIAPSAPSSVLAKRKRDEGVRASDHKKSRAPLSL